MSFSRKRIMRAVFYIFFVLFINLVRCNEKAAELYRFLRASQRHKNPGFVNDRFQKVIIKPEMPEAWVNQYKKPYSPSWMDYCDPYHCSDYHKVVCGLNRKTMRFKWFQSGCHLILNNQCSTYRGFLKFDWVENKFCTAYVMFTRSKMCPADCEDEGLPVCGISAFDGHLVLFENKCALEKANCKFESLNEYELLENNLCYAYMKQLPDTVKSLRTGTCPSTCQDDAANPTCGMSITNQNFRLFRNKCAMEKANCDPENPYDYVEAIMGACVLEDMTNMFVPA